MARVEFDDPHSSGVGPFDDLGDEGPVDVAVGLGEAEGCADDRLTGEAFVVLPGVAPPRRGCPIDAEYGPGEGPLPDQSGDTVVDLCGLRCLGAYPDDRCPGAHRELDLSASGQARQEGRTHVPEGRIQFCDEDRAGLDIDHFAALALAISEGPAPWSRTRFSPRLRASSRFSLGLRGRRWARLRIDGEGQARPLPIPEVRAFSSHPSYLGRRARRSGGDLGLVLPLSLRAEDHERAPAASRGQRAWWVHAVGGRLEDLEQAPELHAAPLARDGEPHSLPGQSAGHEDDAALGGDHAGTVPDEVTDEADLFTGSVAPAGHG
ncbi:MAG: hypothetical protein JRH11_27375 [Deltaproteobacteria bacterium]|nr:hypothetical protein [Deltaproteobacteria bacterium]